MSYSPQGRGARGKVDEAAVRRIRQLAGQGQSTRALADAYGLTPEAVRRIVRWDTWRWVSEEGAGFVQPVADPEDIAASQERLLASLAAEGITPSPGLGKLQALAAAAARPEALLVELTGQLDSNGIPCGIPPAVGGTDGGSK